MADPEETPLTTPELLTEALTVLLLHVPPVVPSLSVIVEPTQTVVEPEMVPAVGDVPGV